MVEASDRDLVLRTRGGEVDAFGEIVRRHQTSVFNTCYRLLGERREAEDLAQEAFLRAFARLAAYDVDRPFGPWVRTLAARLCLNHLERGGPPRLPFDEESDRAPSREADPEFIYQGREREQAIRRGLWSLSARQRAVVELRHFQGLSYREIADVLDIPISDVKSLLFRGRKALAERLRDVD